MYLDRQTIFDAIPPLETSSQTVTIVGDGVVLNENERTFDEGIESSSTVESTGWEVTVTRDRTLLEDRLDRLAALQTLVLVIVVLVMVVSSEFLRTPRGSSPASFEEPGSQ